MKKLFFSFVMMIALVIVTGSAMAAVNNTVIQGGTYPYSLNGLVVVGAGSYVEITYTTGTGATFSGITEQTPTALTAHATLLNTWMLPVGSTSLKFNVAYSASATNGTIHIKITDGVSLCTNEISLAITVTAAPTIDLAVTADQSSYCQTTATITDNTAASSSSANTITYTVTPTVTNAPANYTWGYTIAIPDPTLGSYTIKKGGTDVTAAVKAGQSYTGIAKTVLSETYVITFTSTTGAAAKSLTGTATVVKLTDTGTGAGVYSETVTGNNAATVTIKSLATIGSFQ